MLLVLVSILETGFSFPSGHSAVSAAFYMYLAYVIITNINIKWIKCVTSVVFPILILSIGISRVYLGVHYASDVLAGFAFAIVYLALYITFVLKLFKIEN